MDAALRRFLEDTPVGVLATRRKDGTVRQSVVYHVLDGDRLLISTVSARAKARDVERDGWASYCVMGPQKPYPSVTVEGPARVSTESLGSRTTQIFEHVLGQPPDQPMTDEQVAEMNRVILEIDVERSYGASYPSPPTA